MITLFILIPFVKSIIRTKKPLAGFLIISAMTSAIIFGVLTPQITSANFFDLSLSALKSLTLINKSETTCKLDKSAYEVKKTVKMMITAYSSTPDQTDDTPFTTASGKEVSDGIIANNMLPFGAKVRIPELYGDKIFIVEDRMHQRKGLYHADIWMPNYEKAKTFGAKVAYIEVLEN